MCCVCVVKVAICCVLCNVCVCVVRVAVCRHLDGAVLESLSRPHLLITDAYNALNVQARRKERDQALLSECATAEHMSIAVYCCSQHPEDASQRRQCADSCGHSWEGPGALTAAG